jgi:hypothetical protein
MSGKMKYANAFDLIINVIFLHEYILCYSRALCVLIEYLFVKLGKRRVVATVDARNMASLALFRRKLKFREEGFFLENVFFKGEWGSEVQFALLRREWPIITTTNTTTTTATATATDIASSTTHSSSTSNTTYSNVHMA